MKTLFIGSNLGYLGRLRDALSLSKDEVFLVHTAAELAEVDIREVGVVFLDLLWQSENEKRDTNIDSAIKLLHKAGYKGRIEACANNPHGNSYIAKLLGGSTVWEDPEEREYPDLSPEEIAAKLAPLLAA